MNIENGIKSLLKSGIKIKKIKDIPYFHADNDNPNIIIRELNGNIEHGRIIGKEFIKI